MFETLRIALRKRNEYRRVAAMSRDEFETFKLGKFRRLVRHANTHSPYYRRLIADRGLDLDRCVPTDFPVLTKSLLMAYFDEIATVPEIRKQAIAGFLSRSHDPTEKYLGRYRVIHTSGSSGEVGYFVYSPEDWARGAAFVERPGFRRPRPARKRRGRFRLAFYGAIDGHYAGVTMLAAIKDSWLARRLVDVGLFEINQPLPEVIAALNEFQPEVLAGYTTALKILATKQAEGSLRLDVLTGIMTAGEVTTQHDKALLSDAFGCGVTNGYGSSEQLGMGSASPDSEDMVLFDDDHIYELHDDHTNVTNLFNYTLPLIRYRMADILRPLADMSRYRPYLAVESLVGRTEIQPVFTTEDGGQDFISPHTINEVFVAGLNRFQMHVQGDDEFRFLVCLDPALDAAAGERCVQAVHERLREILARKRMRNVRFEVVVTDDLPVDPKTRKFRLIVDARSGAHATQPG